MIANNTTVQPSTKWKNTHRIVGYKSIENLTAFFMTKQFQKKI